MPTLNSKTRPGAGFASGPLLFALAVSWASAVQAQTPVPARPPAVELSAQASRTVANDLARLTAYVEMSEANPAELARKVNTRVTEALALAKSYATVKVRSGGSFTYPVYAKTGRSIESWRMRSEIALESRDIASLAELAGKLQTVAAVSQLSVDVAPETARKAEDEAVVDAIRAFEARAGVVTRALGKHYRIAQLNVGGMDSRPMPMAKAARGVAMAMEAAPMPVEAGESTITVTVSGSVELVD